jgi:bone morphogenetic protein 2/4
MTGDQTNNTISQDKIAHIRRDYIRLMNEQHRAEYGPFLTPVKVMNPELHSKLTEAHFSTRNPQLTRRREKRGLPYNKLPKRKKKACSIHELYVDFEEIGWSGWILSPKGYNAYHCKGACQFPLGQNQQPTNHATVQSIVHAFRAGKDIGTPCCVPNQLYSISLLYFDDHENVILKLYDDMVAASCGCH